MLPAVDSRVFKIVGGNALLPERLLAAAGARMKSGWVVDTVRPGRSGRFELHARRRRHHGGQAENSAASQSKRGGEEGAAQRDGEEGCPGMGPGPAERRAEAEVKAAAAREEEAAAAIRKSSWDQARPPRRTEVVGLEGRGAGTPPRIDEVVGLEGRGPSTPAAQR